MSFSSSPVTMHRPVTTQTTSALNLRTSTPKLVFPPSARHVTQQKCCDTGRPVMIDPMTGGTICSCQLKSGIPSYLARVPTLPETVYGAAAAGNQFPSNVFMGPEASSAFYQMNMKSERSADGMKVAPPGGVHSPFYLEHLMTSHPYTPFYPGFDLNSARRKNATRETTSALKAWLFEHRKNPYPTKGEKIMLAIITRMTLTQVSTWFANARRRLKKESKMDDKDIDLSDIEVDGQSERGSGDMRLSVSDDEEEANNINADLSDISDAEESSSTSKSPQSSCTDRVFSPQKRSDTTLEHHTSNNDKESSPSDNIVFGERCIPKQKSSPSNKQNGGVSRENSNSKSTNQSPPQPRPKIWSISEIISSDKSKNENDS